MKIRAVGRYRLYNGLPSVLMLNGDERNRTASELGLMWKYDRLPR
jgi:hypothetical protein